MNPWTFDLSSPSPLSKTKRSKKDHKCPHDRKHPTGMEVCEKCGDYSICVECGIDYIKQDVYGGPRCWMCEEVRDLRVKLANKMREQQIRQSLHRKAEVESET